MADYGGFQIKRTVALGPFTSVHEAVAADGRPGRFALKVFHPPPSAGIKRFYAVEGWLLAAERQQQAAKKDGTVVEVLACGRCDEGAYMVMAWQERPLEPFVTTLHVKGDTLRAVAECLLNTIEKWEEQTGGPHGNIKASNVFLTRGGSLAGMTARLSDSWFRPGATPEQLRHNDLAAVGAILAHMVRRRPHAVVPIEDAPEWRALGKPGKAWLDFCNDLLNPSPEGGALTVAEARKRLRRVPKDSNPVKVAVLAGLAAVILLGGSVVTFARFGDPNDMPRQVQNLAVALRNPRAYRDDVTPNWALLCRAWDTWLADLQNNARRLDRTTALWAPNDPLKVAIANFLAQADAVRPERLVPEAAGRSMSSLAASPPEKVVNELRKVTVYPAVDEAYSRVSNLAVQFERWQRWEEMRALLGSLEERGFTSAAGALRPRLPAVPGGAGYKLDVAIANTAKLFNTLSLDDAATLPLAARWSEMTNLTKEMTEHGDRVMKAMPAIIKGRLTDRTSLADFADSLVPPLEEMRLRWKQFNDPQLMQDRFKAESPLQTETAEVTEADFPRWEEELVAYSLVPEAEDPRLVPTINATMGRLPQAAQDLEADAPAAEPGGLPTLSTADFQREMQAKTAELEQLRARKIVRRDLPVIVEETNKFAENLTLLQQRIEVTLALLNPQTWLEKVAKPYEGKFNESRRRWAAWQATLAGLTADALRADRPRMRALRAQERQMREWLDGLEGPNGFGALAVPELTAASADSAAELLRVESLRREQAAAAVAAAAEWRNALPVTAWASANAAVRAPLESHRAWLAALPQFAASLDRLNELLTAGFEWAEGVQEVMNTLAGYGGLDELQARPAEWRDEARQLAGLVNSTDRAALTAAAQAGGLSRKLMAWRRLGNVAGWPGGAEDFDFDRGVVAVMREVVGRDVQDEARKTGLLDEMVRETRVRFNRAARAAAVAEEALSAMFERLQPAGLTETDLEDPVAYNLALWRLKRADRNEQNLEKLRVRRDEFVNAVRTISGVAAQSTVDGFLRDLSSIELKDDPNRPATPSPRMAGWQEEPTNEGFGLTATWTGGGKKVTIEYLIVKPEDGTQPFYLARRAVAVGEFVDLINGRARGADTVLNELPNWSRKRPWNMPVSWDRDPVRGLFINEKWISVADSQVAPLLDNTELQATAPVLTQAVNERPGPRSPVQQLPPLAAKLFAERVLGARLPRPEEWRAVASLAGKPAEGFFRGQSFQQLWSFLENFREGGVTLRWRPTAGIYTKPRITDNGQPSPLPDKGRLWFAPVDEGPDLKGFLNLFGNVWIYLEDPNKKNAFFVAGGSVLSSPTIDILEPQAVEGSGLIGVTTASTLQDGYSDVGIRPAFDAPPGFLERYKFFKLVKDQKYLTL